MHARRAQRPRPEGTRLLFVGTAVVLLYVQLVDRGKDDKK